MLKESNAQLVIDSVSFVVQTGAVVTVTGDISSAKGLPAMGKFLLQGPDSQSVNMNGKLIPNLVIANPLGVWLKSNMKVSNSLQFLNGKFVIDDYNFSLADLTDVTGMGDGKFIETTGIGNVLKEVSINLSSNEIAVGAGTIYRPVFLTTSGNNTGGIIGIKLRDTASTNKPPSTSDFLKANWTITKTGINGTLNVDAKYDKSTDLVGSESYLKGYLFDGVDWASLGTINTSTSTISFPVTMASANITAIDKFDLLKAKVFLQGAYDGSTSLMSDYLRSIPQFPLSDPYRTSPYSSAFTQVNDAIPETINSSVLSGNQSAPNDNIVDWVFIELRDKTTGKNILQTRSALVQRDGDIVDVDGKSPVTFNNVDPGNYTIAIRHRNHLGLSTDPASINPYLSEKQSTATMVDFTNSAFLFGGLTAHGKASDGKFVLWGGNANMNGVVNFTGPGNDKDYILSSILGGLFTKQITGYNNGDLNMNGIVNYSSPNNDKDFLLSKVLSSVATHSLTQYLP